MLKPICFEAHVQDSEWSCADYSLSWQGGVLRYQAEGRDNPKDLWGFDYSYPPKVMDAYTLGEIERVFGLEPAAQVRAWLQIPGTVA